MKNKTDYYQELDSFYRDQNHLMSKKLVLVSELLPAGERLLDIGCGTGELLARLHNRFRELVGFDSSPEALEYAQSKLKGSKNILLKGNLEELPDEYFDAAACLDVIEHLHDSGVLLRQIRRLLRPDARLIVTVPNWYDIVITGVLKANPLHLQAHTPWGWMRLLRDTGFRVNSWRCVDFPIVHSRCLARRLAWFGMCAMFDCSKKA